MEDPQAVAQAAIAKFVEKYVFVCMYVSIYVCMYAGLLMFNVFRGKWGFTTLWGGGVGGSIMYNGAWPECMYNYVCVCVCSYHSVYLYASMCLYGRLRGCGHTHIHKPELEHSWVCHT